jgi:hypothetical protein
MPAARGEKIVMLVPRSCLLLELVALDRLTDLVVGDFELRPRRQRLLLVHCRDLLLAVALRPFGSVV